MIEQEVGTMKKYVNTFIILILQFNILSLYVYIIFYFQLRYNYIFISAEDNCSKI